jgi:hypothetical protein
MSRPAAALEKRQNARVLAGRDTDAVRLQALADLSVARDVVRRGGLLDKPGGWHEQVS